MNNSIYNLFTRCNNLRMLWHTPTSAILTIRMIRSALYNYFEERFIYAWDNQKALKYLKAKIEILYYKREVLM